MKLITHLGQELWYVEHSYRKAPSSQCRAVVSNIGRKWATIDLDGSSFSVQASIEDGLEKPDSYTGQITGRAYSSRQIYQAAVELKTVWEDFYRRLSGATPPNGLTLERLHEIAKEFDIPVAEKELADE